VKLLREGEPAYREYVAATEARGLREPPRIGRSVRTLLDGVREKGDEALIRCTERFDGVHLSASELEVTRKERKTALRGIPGPLLKALRKAASRIRAFHRRMRQDPIIYLEMGIRLGQIVAPLERVGIYVPGGKASYPSTVLMAAIPARVAGVKEIVMVTPPRREGISPAVLAAAEIAGVDRVFRVGGVQAIGGLAYGTATLPRVDKIVGPGNRYVAEAKRLVYGTVDIDMVAGPSEIVIVADGTTPAPFAAADLISQAEHDEQAVAILITCSQVFAEEVRGEVERQLSSLEKERIARKSLEGKGAILVTADLEAAIDLANRIAPEHLELAVKKPLSLLKRVKHAGAVFLGAYTPEAIGDYLAGPDHILPTAGTARFSSALSVYDFYKRTSVMGFSREALARFAGDVRELARWEGLEGHGRAVDIRMTVSGKGRPARKGGGTGSRRI
jgi:histidinol dehydrogenase